MTNKLTFEEVRIIGALIEKEITTPEYYPMTINAITNACNQKSSREPVVNYNNSEIEENLNILKEKKLIRRVTGDDMRVPKFRQILTEELKLSSSETAILCVLMLRGSQTPGEIKGRTGRMFEFVSTAQVENELNNLISREEPLVKKLPRKPGTKESRYAHLLSDEIETDINLPKPGLEERLTAAEEEIVLIKNEMNEIKEFLKKFTDLL